MAVFCCLAASNYFSAKAAIYQGLLCRIYTKTKVIVRILLIDFLDFQ
jgi:hypothetical protein